MSTAGAGLATFYFGRRPESVVADKGFCPDVDTCEELQEQVDYLGMPRRIRDFGDSMMSV